MGELGSMLIRAREARGLTLEDAERDTRISRRYLLALENEEFEVIPAPVYARGFLRSYSQYLGLDPKEALELFPSDEPALTTPSSHRPSMEQPISPVSASRPSWRRPQPPQGGGYRPNGSGEPMIGVDIGVPVPARRMKSDPAAQARAATVAIVAIGVIVGVLLLAFIISRLGDDAGGQGGPLDGGQATSTTGGSGQAAPTRTAQAARPGTVPDVIGKSSSVARDEITAAGYKVSELPQASSQPRGIVIEQAPAGETALDTGQTVIIVVSQGP
jgi:transcriptional regulator with XRE-family HTH domain